MKENETSKISLIGSVALGTGVMIGAGIFALVGQVAELAGSAVPWAFAAGAVVAAVSAYSYVRCSSADPSSGGIAMILKAAYGPGVVAAFYVRSDSRGRRSWCPSWLSWQLWPRRWSISWVIAGSSRRRP